MATMKALLKDGTVKEIEGRKFSHYVDNCRFWFFLHEGDHIGHYCVSHYESGKRVCSIKPTDVRGSSYDDMKAAAKAAIDELVNRVGAARVRSVLAGAGQ